MAQDEFAIIRQYFSEIGEARADTVLGIGDDAAIIETMPGYQQVLSLDTLITGVHFPHETAAADIGYKALAVNLSDLAAMAAEPAWFLLSLTLPDRDPDWLAEFSSGLRQAASGCQLQLIGGDTCAGALSISIQIIGQVPQGQYVSRAGAKPGDLIVVSGQLGNAGLGLAHLQATIELPASLIDFCVGALNRPRPRLELSAFLRDYATAAIDLSDGLLGDLSHILKASGCGARVDQSALPVSDYLREQGRYDLALGAGDDYELCFTLPVKHAERIDDWNQHHPECPLSVIGEITDQGFTLKVGDQHLDVESARGFRHFE